MTNDERRHASSDRARRSVPRRLAVVSTVLLATAAMVAACTPAPPSMKPIPSPVDRAEYRVMAGIEQIYVVGAKQGDRIQVTSTSGESYNGVADRLGSLAIRELTQGRSYKVTNLDSGVATEVRVLVASENPPQSFYAGTKMREGLNYIPMRDGITLAATVRPPIGQSLSDGPFPTVIEYSGYEIAAPHDSLAPKLLSGLGIPYDPLAPSASTDVGSLLVRLAGFATVSLQMRGSGCSGGEADLFDLPTRYDGYDAVETVAAQRWVKGGRVGMVGISFSGFSQIATAATQPPHLAAIAPLSFVGSLYDLGRPGGIFNNGFAESWLKERQENARPAPDPRAQAYANYMVAKDKNCRDNQRLRLQTRDAIEMVRSEELNVDIYKRRDFRNWMSQIRVPTFASLQFNDEETSPYAILSAQTLLDSNDKVWLNLANGHHRDAVTPDTITQMFEFLDIYVAHRPPEVKVAVNLVSDIIFGEGSAKPPLPSVLPTPDRLFNWTLSAARREFERKPRVRVMLGLQSGMNEFRSSGTQWKFDADQFPVAGSIDQTWYLDNDGALSAKPGRSGEATYSSDPSARPATSGVPGATPSDPVSDIDWKPVPQGDGIGFVTQPLDEALVALGPAAANIRLSSNARDTDIGVTISEVRADGQEMLVSTGVQRASMRHTNSTSARAVTPSFTLDRKAYLDGSTVTVPVQILPIGHVFAKGSRIRISIHAVGGDTERWAYDSIDPAGGLTQNTVILGGTEPSSLTMTVAHRTGFKTTPLRCPAVGMPCRSYTPDANGG